MREHEIRWWVLIAVGMLIGFGQLFLEISGSWFSFPARPDWFWCLAFCAALRTSPVSAIAVFGLCGVMRDLLLGPRLGAGAIAFVAVGWLALSWRVLAVDRGWMWAALLAGVTAFLEALLRHSLEYGMLAHKLVERVFFVSLGDAALTALGYLPLTLVLAFHSFRPWRERSGF